MPVTDLALVWLGTVALAVTGVQLLRVDGATRVLAGFLGAVAWGTTGLAAYSVHSEAYAGTQPMRTVVIFGFLMAILSGMLALWSFAQYLGIVGGASPNTGLIIGGERR